VSLWLSGVGISRGTAIGSVHRFGPQDPEAARLRAIDTEAVDGEMLRFERALDFARQELRAIRKRIPTGTPADVRTFIDTYLLMLDDRSIAHATVEQIRSERISAEWALCRARDAVFAVFDAMSDDYLKTRRDDVAHVCDRILRALRVGPSVTAGDAAGVAPAGAIVVADDLAVADLVLLGHQDIAGLVTEQGGALSHTAILARSFGIPAVAGVRGARQWLRDGEPVVIDGQSGQILASPDTPALVFFRAQVEREAEERRALSSIRSRSATTLDGSRIRLLANIDMPDEVETVSCSGAEGIGLFRTEFLFMQGTYPPSEEEQFACYAHVLRETAGMVTIRTLDAGGDKPLVGAEAEARNPALGLRAVRYSLKEVAPFKAQLRALLRASVHGRLRILVPMVGAMHELLAVRRLVAECRRELASQGEAMASRVPLGIMIEVPSAALNAAWLAQECRFFSVGTNDLVQYTLAIDRADDEVNHLFDPLHPAVLYLLHRVVRAADEAGIPVSLCGEMGGDVRLTALLIGLGFTELSMHPSLIPEVKRQILQLEMVSCRARVGDLLQARSPAAFRRALGRLGVATEA